MAFALGTNYNDTATPDRIQQAYKHLTEAQNRAANGNDAERSYVEALAKRYVEKPDDGNQPKREEAYSAAMGELSKHFPDDLDAATLYAESMPRNSAIASAASIHHGRLVLPGSLFTVGSRGRSRVSGADAFTHPVARTAPVDSSP